MLTCKQKLRLLSGGIHDGSAGNGKFIKHQRSCAPAGPGEQDRLLEALRRAGGKKNEAARLLGISRQALWKQMKKSRIMADYEQKNE